MNMISKEQSMNPGVSAGSGYSFQDRAGKVAAIYAYKLAVEKGFRSHSKHSTFLFNTEVIVEVGSEGKSGRMDGTAEVDKNQVMRMEAKWTTGDPIVKASEAITQLFSYKQTSDEPKPKPELLIVIGGVCNKIKSVTAERLDFTAYKDEQFTLSRVLKCDDIGTAVYQYQSATRKITFLFIGAYSDEHEDAVDTYDFATGLAMLLNLNNVDVCEKPVIIKQDIKALGSRCFDQYITSDKPYKYVTKTSIKRFLEAPDIDVGLLINPWSTLVENYLERVAKMRPNKTRWVKLLYESLAQCADGSPLSLSETAVAAKIMPIIVKCGPKKGGNVVREYERTIHSAGTEGMKPEIKILSGIAGSGKSSLLEYLFEHKIASLRRTGGLVPEMGVPVFIDLQNDAKNLDLLEGVSEADKQRCVSAVLLSMSGLTGVESLSGDHPANLAIDAMLFHFNIHLYIDGYDQLADEKQSLLNRLCVYMAELGYKISLIILATRPGHEELKALEWDRVIPGVDKPSAQSIKHLSPPDESDYERYCHEWLDELSTVLPNKLTSDEQGGNVKGQKQCLQTDFENWRATSFSNDFTQDESIGAISSNPLLTSMCLAIYMKSGRGAQRNKTTIKSLADIYKKMVDDFWEDKWQIDRPPREHLEGKSNVTGGNLRNWFERVCYEALRDTRMSTGLISFEYLNNKWNEHPVDGVQEQHGASVSEKWFEAPFFKIEKINGEQYVEFVHSSFQEYFASSFVVDCLSQGAVPAADGEKKDWSAALGLADSAGGVGTIFGDMIVALGRDCFKYILGICNKLGGDGVSKATATLDKLIYLDHGSQQYLYDSGYVDRAFHELKCAAPPANIKALKKLLAHYRYGRNDELVVSLADFVEIAADATVYENDILGISDRWLVIFCLDHIDNRVQRIKPEDVTEVLKQRGSRHYRQYKKEGLQQWCETKLQSLTAGMNVFKENLNEQERVIGFENVLEPDMDTDLPYILRAAHYWGHVGNRELYNITQLSAKSELADPLKAIKKAINKALNAYANAVIYRLFTLSLTAKEVVITKVEKEVLDKITLPD